MKKSRFLLLDKNTNQSKLNELDSLHSSYKAYLSTCVKHLLDNHIFSLPIQDRMKFLPRCLDFSNQVEKCVKAQAVDIVSTWSKAVYITKMKPLISRMKKEGTLTELEAKSLYIVGKYQRDKPDVSLFGSPTLVCQSHIDKYWSLLNEFAGGRNVTGEHVPSCRGSGIRELECNVVVDPVLVFRPELDTFSQVFRYGDSI